MQFFTTAAVFLLAACAVNAEGAAIFFFSECMGSCERHRDNTVLAKLAATFFLRAEPLPVALTFTHRSPQLIAVCTVCRVHRAQ